MIRTGGAPRSRSRKGVAPRFADTGGRHRPTSRGSSPYATPPSHTSRAAGPPARPIHDGLAPPRLGVPTSDAMRRRTDPPAAPPFTIHRAGSVASAAARGADGVHKRMAETSTKASKRRQSASRSSTSSRSSRRRSASSSSENRTSSSSEPHRPRRKPSIWSHDLPSMSPSSTSTSRRPGARSSMASTRSSRSKRRSRRRECSSSPGDERRHDGTRRRRGRVWVPAEDEHASRTSAERSERRRTVGCSSSENSSAR